MGDQTKTKKQLIEELQALRKQAGDALLNEKNCTDSIINSLPGIFYLLDENGCFLRWNLHLEMVSGYSTEEISKMRPLDFFEGEDKKLVENAIREGFTTGNSTVEANLVTKDGSKRLYYFSGKHCYSGNKRCLSGMGIDISALKETEKSLKESEARFRQLFDTAAVPLCFVNKEGVLVDFNDHFAQTFGYTHEDIPTLKEWWRLAYPDPDYRRWVTDTWEAAVRRAARENADIEHIEYDVTCKSGEVRKLVISGTTIGDDVLATFFDITERKRVEEALRASEAELHDQYFTQAAINTILSESLEDIPLELMLQKTLNMILTIPWLSFGSIGSIHLAENSSGVLVMKAQYNLPEEVKTLCAHIPFGKCLCGRAAKTQKIQFADHIDERHDICYEGIEPHGHYVVPILFGGRTLGVIVVYLKEDHIRNQQEEDFLRAVADTLAGIIARKKAEDEQEKLHAQLLQALKMEAVGQLAGGIAHDFNNILTGIIGYSHILKTNMKEDDPLRTYPDYLLTLSERAANLTQSLLAFSRKQVMNPRPINLNEAIRTVEKLLFRIIGEDIRLKTVFSENDLIVMADTGQMEQVLMNLATNARDAMQSGGFLRIRTEQVDIEDEFIREHGFGEEGRYALISVTDTGTGMDKETREKIYEPFFTTKEIGKGTGLGLAMVYGIVKQHNGYINVYSESGEGTTFRIYLPLIQAKAEEIKPEVIHPLETGTETILLAEDDTAVRGLIKKLLEDNGYKVIEAVDGEDAIDRFSLYKDKIQLLLLDVIMPHKNGSEAYEKIREIRPDIKVLFMSGYTADIIQKKRILGERLNFIEKPVTPSLLLKRIREVLKD